MGTDVLQSAGIAELLSPNMPEPIGVKEVDLLKKIIVLFFALIASAAICFAYGVRFDDKQASISDDEIDAILSKYDIQLPAELAVITKETENKFYGKWIVLDDSLGYSLKYDITGGQLFGGFLYISKEKIEEIMTVMHEPYIKSYLSPIFMYYSETLNEMSTDELLNYSGIEELDSETVGIIILGFALSDYSPDNYDLIPTKFILIDDYAIAVRDHSFYKLEKDTRK